ncbi:Carboxypeptidase family protein [Tenacibaculum sp. 190130A14a]|uniref:Carboxypeptidase family protein n=2 Tax=Tenacibaculum polynesiense TaxID=3137857 RepID=A0ABM9PBL2_9FLAO
MLSIFLSCTRKVYHCGMASYSYKGKDEYFLLKSDTLPSLNFISKILILKRLKPSNSNLTSITGKVFDNSIDENDTLTLPFANVVAKNQVTDSIIGTITNEEGMFELNLPPSKYNLEIEFIGFNTLIIKNVKISKGNHMYLSSILGSGRGTSLYDLNYNQNFFK